MRINAAFFPLVEKIEAAELERIAAVRREFDQWRTRKSRERGFERER
jgi:hypothetical protein